MHPDLVAWDDMPEEEYRLDGAQIDALPRIAEAGHRRLAKALIIGVAGQRTGHAGLDEARVKQELHGTLTDLLASHPGHAPLLLTTLATGTDTWAAQAASDLHIPYQVVLPLPWELYREDFTPAEAKTLRALIDKAEYRVELPLRFGRASALTAAHEPTREANRPRRNAQYALAGAYMVERAHHMICVCDPEAPVAEGGTGQVASWIEAGVPAKFRTGSRFFLRLAHPAKTMIKPNGDSLVSRS